MKKNSLSMEDVVQKFITTFSDLKESFKNETYLSRYEDTEFGPGEEVTPDDLIHDEHHNDQYECSLSFPSSRRQKFIDVMKKEFGEPKVNGEMLTWDFGHDNSGYFSVYDREDTTHVDVTYNYDKV